MAITLEKSLFMNDNENTEKKIQKTSTGYHRKNLHWKS